MFVEIYMYKHNHMLKRLLLYNLFSLSEGGRSHISSLCAYITCTNPDKIFINYVTYKRPVDESIQKKLW